MSDPLGASAHPDQGDIPSTNLRRPSETKTDEGSDATPQTEEHHDQQSQYDDNDDNDKGEEKGTSNENEENEQTEETAAPPLPDEVPPPLPDEAPPGQPEDDGWEPVWDANAQSYYFYNRFTQASQWENPRVPQAQAPGTGANNTSDEPPKKKPAVIGGYNPAIHGDYDPTAAYAQNHENPEEQDRSAVDPAAAYEAVGKFNRFTGRWQAASINPDNHNDENKSGRQMNAYFDVDAAANSHDGRSLRAERSQKRLSKKEVKAFKDKRREKKEEKRRAWLRD